MKAVAFDLGDTLVEYEGLPMSWEAQYAAALLELARFLGILASADQIRAACEVLRAYNTRLTPRSREVDFAAILRDILIAMSGSFHGEVDEAAAAFFSVFRQGRRCFPDTFGRLDSFRKSGVKVGVLTDVPYGMPRRLILEDMEDCGILALIDEVVTSVDAGVRKPDARGLGLLASRLGVRPQELSFVGNERKDVEVALAFGCEAVLLDRERLAPEWGQHRTIRTLAEL